MLAACHSESTVSTSSGSKKRVGYAGRLSVQLEVEPCKICGKVVSRAFDLKRHLKTHDSDPNKKLPCKWKGCKYRTRQKSNLATHYRRHTQSKKFRCTDDPLTCIFKTCDPASLLRHRKRYHGYTTSRCKFDSESGNSSALPSEPSSSILPSGETSSSSLMPPQPPSPNLCQESLLFPASPPLDIEFWAAEPNWSHGWIQPSHPGYQHEFQNSQLGFTGTTSFTGVNGMFFDYLADPYQHPDYFDQRLWDFVISLQNF